jgi:hypothetical protein
MTLFILTIPLMVLAVGLAGATGAWSRPQIEDENVSVVPSAGAP